MLDDKIFNNTVINHHLEQIAQTIFKSWFVDFEPFADCGFIETELGKIPAGWRILTLCDVCDIKGGKRLPKGENLVATRNNHPYIRVRDMNNAIYVQMNDAIEYVSDEIQHSISRFIVTANDIIVSIVGTIGMVCKVHPSLDKANLTENCVKLTNLRDITSDFLYLFLSSPDGQEAIKRGTVGAVQAKLPIKNIQAISFVCPPSSVMSDFDDIMSQTMLMIANNYAENQRLTTLRDTLLPRLMSGELSVSDIDKCNNL
jgi:type I restriction enzyme S subunit